MDDREREVERIEQGNAWQDSDEVVDIDVGRSLDKIVPVRLPTDLWEELRREARELGIGPSMLVRMWVLEKLRQIRRAHQPA